MNDIRGCFNRREISSEGEIFVRAVKFATTAHLLVTFAIGTFCVLAHAQGEVAPSIPVDSAAKLSDEAFAHVHKGDFEGARRLYKRAYATAPSAPILFNLALSELNSGWGLDALAHFRAYANDPAADPANVALVTKDLLPRALAATGHLDIGSAPAGSSFLVDGVVATTADAKILDVEPGEHLIVAQTGTTSVQAREHVEAGVTIVVQFPKHAALAATPASREQPVLTPDRDVPRPPAPRGSGRLPVTLTLAGAGVASVIGGVVFYALNQSANSRWQSLHNSLAPGACASPSAADVGPCANLASALNETNSDATLSGVFEVAGGVLMVGSIVTYLLWPHPIAEKHARLAPTMNPLTRSVGVVGTF